MVFSPDRLWGIGTEEQSLDLTRNSFQWRAECQITDYPDDTKGEEVKHKM